MSLATTNRHHLSPHLGTFVSTKDRVAQSIKADEQRRLESLKRDIVAGRVPRTEYERDHKNLISLWESLSDEERSRYYGFGEYWRKHSLDHRIPSEDRMPRLIRKALNFRSYAQQGWKSCSSYIDSEDIEFTDWDWKKMWTAQEAAMKKDLEKLREGMFPKTEAPKKVVSTRPSTHILTGTMVGALPTVGEAIISQGDQSHLTIVSDLGDNAYSLVSIEAKCETDFPKVRINAKFLKTFLKTFGDERCNLRVGDDVYRHGYLELTLNRRWEHRDSTWSRTRIALLEEATELIDFNKEAIPALSIKVADLKAKINRFAKYGEHVYICGDTFTVRGIRGGAGQFTEHQDEDLPGSLRCEVEIKPLLKVLRDMDAKEKVTLLTYGDWLKFAQEKKSWFIPAESYLHDVQVKEDFSIASGEVSPKPLLAVINKANALSVTLGEDRFSVETSERGSSSVFLTDRRGVGSVGLDEKGAKLLHDALKNIPPSKKSDLDHGICRVELAKYGGQGIIIVRHPAEKSYFFAISAKYEPPTPTERYLQRYHNGIYNQLKFKFVRRAL